MHTDDDIFESLSIDEASDNGIKTGNEMTGNGGNTAGVDDIFEDLEMEDKIFETALIKEDKEKSGRSEKRETAKSKPASKSSAAKNAPADKKTARSKNPKVLNTVDSSVDRKTYTKEKEKKKKSKIKKIIICTIIEIFTLAVIFAYGYFLRSWNLIARPEIKLEAIENNNISLEKKKEMEGYWNIAVFGVDSRNANVVERGLNSDVIMIASINKDTGEIKLVSVFRDTYLNISEKNSYNKINQAYAIGGPEQALAALNKNLDLNIQNYITFNWKAVAEGINILGGVDNIPISKAELYYINAYITETVKVTKIGSYQLTGTGTQHLDGVQAVAYGRLRYMDNDFARTERQRNIIKASFEKAKKANFSVLNNIMVVCFPQVATNIDFNDVIEMAQHITQYNIGDTGGFPWSRGDANIGKKGDCVIPTTLESNVVKLHEFLFGDANYTPSDAVLNISEKIKSDSNLYKEGKFIESVSTDGGVIQKPKVAATVGDAPSEGGSSSDGGSKTPKVTLGVDEDGNYIYPTDSDGNIIVPTNEDGKVIYPTDADGNIIKESARPTELSTDDMTPGGYSNLTPGGDRNNTEFGPGYISNTNPTSRYDNTASTPGGNSTGNNNEHSYNTVDRDGYVDYSGGPGSVHNTVTPGNSNSPASASGSSNIGDRPSGLDSSSNAPGSSGSSSASPAGNTSNTPGGSVTSPASNSTDGPSGSVTSPAGSSTGSPSGSTSSPTSSSPSGTGNSAPSSSGGSPSGISMEPASPSDGPVGGAPGGGPMVADGP